jgi:hypothetical protein
MGIRMVGQGDPIAPEFGHGRGWGWQDKAAMEMGGSPVRGAGDVGATHQALKGIPSGEEQWVYMVLFANGGSPRRGQDDALDGKCDSGDGDSDGPGRATRSGQNLIMEEDGRGQDNAAMEMGGSPVRGAGRMMRWMGECDPGMGIRMGRGGRPDRGRI